MIATPNHTTALAPRPRRIARLVQRHHDYAIGPNQGIDKVRFPEDRLGVQLAVSVSQAHLHVVFTPRDRRDVLGQACLYGLGLRHLDTASQRVQGGPYQETDTIIADTGLPGSPKAGLSSIKAIIVGLPGRCAIPCQDTGRAKAVQHLHGHIGCSPSSAEDEHVGLCQPLYSHLALRLIVVLHHPHGDRHAASLFHQGAMVYVLMSRICPGAGVVSGETISSPVDTIATRGRQRTLTWVKAERQQAADILRSEQSARLGR